MDGLRSHESSCCAQSGFLGTALRQFMVADGCESESRLTVLCFQKCRNLSHKLLDSKLAAPNKAERLAGFGELWSELQGSLALHSSSMSVPGAVGLGGVWGKVHPI